MTKFLTIDECGTIRRFSAPDIDIVRAWAGRNGVVLTTIEPVPSPGRWDVFQTLTDSPAPVTPPKSDTCDCCGGAGQSGAYCHYCNPANRPGQTRPIDSKPDGEPFAVVFGSNDNKPHNTMKTDIDTKIIALAQHLGCEPDELREANYDHYGLTVYTLAVVRRPRLYAVGTDEECDEACVAYCRDSIWAFNADFIVGQCDLPHELADCLKPFQENECEGANRALLALVEKTCGLERFAADAASADGRGHFLSPYDGEENEVNGRFIYRIN